MAWRKQVGAVMVTLVLVQEIHIPIVSTQRRVDLEPPCDLLSSCIPASCIFFFFCLFFLNFYVSITL